MGGLMFSIMLGSYIFVGSKDLLWVYKKSPRNVQSLIYSYMLLLLVIIVIISTGLTITFTIIYEYTLFDTMLFFFAFIANSMACLSCAVGIQCLHPAFEEKGKNMGTNMFYMMFLQIGIFILSLIVIFELFPELENEELSKIVYIPMFIGVQAIIGVPIFILGIRKLKKIE